MIGAPFLVMVVAALVVAYHLPLCLPTHKKRIHYRKSIKYQLAETYRGNINIRLDADIETDWITLTTRGAITIQRGYGWDGPSGPTWDTQDFMRGALVHDALYQLIRLKLLGENDLERESFRNAADLEMKRILKADGMDPIRRFVVYKGVSIFASFAADPANRRKVIAAPLHV